MAEEQNPEVSDNTEVSGITISNDDTKPTIRNKVWDYLQKSRLASFPWPPHGRIPNYRGSKVACSKVTEMEEFTNAQILKVDPDTPLQQIRYDVLEKKKTLLVPSPRLISHLLNRIEPPANSERNMNRICSAKQGIREFSSPVGFEDDLHIDLLIVGAVAVSTKGWRIGKGEGFSDLEYAMTSMLGFVKPNILTIAVVHDCQVLDLPDNLFEAHDVPIDVIVTPTRIIRCDGRQPKPEGVFWNILTSEKLSRIPSLRKLRFREWKAGKNVCLKDETETPTDLVDEDIPAVANEMESRKEKDGERRSNRGPRKDRTRARRSGSRKVKENGEVDENGERKEGGMDERKRDGGDGNRKSYRDNRRGRRGGNTERVKKVDDDRHDGEGDRRRDSEDVGGSEDDRLGVPGERHRRRSFRGGYGGRMVYNQGEGSLYVGNIPRNLRVSEFKYEVHESSVNPLRVIWRGSSGFAFLNFKTVEDAKDALAALEGLQIKDRSLRVEMAKERRSTRPQTDDDVKGDDVDGKDQPIVVNKEEILQDQSN